MTPETTTFIEYFLQHWERFLAGLVVLFGFIYQTGHEHQKYNDLRKRVACLESSGEERMAVVTTMNSNLCRIMGKLGIQPVENNTHRRKED
jgi:hypothetical protein